MSIQFYNHFEKLMKNSPEIDLNTDTIKIELMPNGVGYLGKQNFFQKLWQKWNKSKYDNCSKIEFKATHAFIYQETPDRGMFDIETRARLHGDFKPMMVILDDRDD